MSRSSKRIRVSSSNSSEQDRCAKFVTEMFDLFAITPRPERDRLLLLVLQSVPSSAFASIRAAAVKSGAIVETHSKFQERCAVWMFDSIFAFLPELDLR